MADDRRWVEGRIDPRARGDGRLEDRSKRRVFRGKVLVEPSHDRLVHLVDVRDPRRGDADVARSRVPARLPHHVPVLLEDGQRVGDYVRRQAKRLLESCLAQGLPLRAEYLHERAVLSDVEVARFREPLFQGVARHVECDEVCGVELEIFFVCVRHGILLIIHLCKNILSLEHVRHGAFEGNSRMVDV